MTVVLLWAASAFPGLCLQDVRQNLTRFVTSRSTVNDMAVVTYGTCYNQGPKSCSLWEHHDRDEDVEIFDCRSDAW